MSVLNRDFSKATKIGLGALSVAALVAGIQIPKLYPLTPTVPDVSKIASVCTTDRSCYGMGMKEAMKGPNGQISLNSPIGKGLRQIAAQGDVSETAVLELMNALDHNFNYSKNISTFEEAEGIFAIRPPQYKSDPQKPFSAVNPYLYPEYNLVVVLATKSGECPSFTLSKDGKVTKISDVDSLPRLIPTSSHAISSEECARKRNKFMNKMEMNQS